MLALGSGGGKTEPLLKETIKIGVKISLTTTVEEVGIVQHFGLLTDCLVNGMIRTA